jgi:hypothetical protein
VTSGTIVRSKRLPLDGVARRFELEHHRYRRSWVVSVNDEKRRLKVSARLVAQPADDGQAAVVAVLVCEALASQIVVQVDLIPWLAEITDAVGSRLYPDRMRVIGQKLDSTRGVIVEEQYATIHV